ncbi:MAG TPA: mannose-6-phosphate isomerase, class I [Actinobacteria bacterium]|nr:mannose-6-phosphate isomerase, class I [Actinomycetota bacterium]
MHRIAGYLQNYAWGIPGGLAAWRGGSDEAVPAGTTPAPEAELWYGAHVNGPSPLASGSGSLTDLVTAQDAPVLVKLLAAARPLSIQIHPPSDQAARNFAAQEADPSLPKLLADGLAKTEMLIAVRPFSVLQGMRDPKLAAAILRKVGGSAQGGADLLDAGDPKGAIRLLLAVDPAELSELTPKVAAAAAAAGLGTAGVEALATVAGNYPGDAGVLVAVLMDQRVLAEGDAVYVPAGVVHAYVSGTGVEVMTASDNVLRLGLTPKTIAVDEALDALDPSLTPQPMSGEPTPLPSGGTHRHYAPAGAPFIVDWIGDGSFTAIAGDYRLVLAVSSSVTVATGGTEIVLSQGQAAAVLADEGDVLVTTTGAAVIARSAAQ